MHKNIIFSLVILSLVLLLIPPVWAESNNTQPVVTQKANKELDLPCIQKAIEKRENAIIAAFTQKSDAIKAALGSRNSTLKEAWGNSNQKERIAARIKAWNDYRLAIKKARQTYYTEIKAAWTQFKKDRRVCGQPVEVETPNTELNL